MEAVRSSSVLVARSEEARGPRMRESGRLAIEK